MACHAAMERPRDFIEDVTIPRKDRSHYAGDSLGIFKVERDRKWRFALADMGITVECFLDEK